MMGDAGVFERALKVVIGQEGGFTDDPADPGNWTGGRVGSGKCNGTKFGISAASYPGVNISGLDIERAGEIYRSDYWDKVQGSRLPPALALLVLDAAVNNGVGRAVRWLQVALGVKPDGQLGKATLAAIDRQGAATIDLLTEFQAQRLMFMAGLPTWRTFGAGWSRRLSRLAVQAMQFGEQQDV